MELRRQSEAAGQDAASAERDGSETDGSAPVKKGRTTTAAATRPARKSSRKKTPQRTRVSWGVFNGSMQRVALFDYAERGAADARAKELSSTAKGHHFVQVVKEAIIGTDE
jgi:hypothetical protein